MLGPQRTRPARRRHHHCAPRPGAGRVVGASARPSEDPAVVQRADGEPLARTGTELEHHATPPPSSATSRGGTPCPSAHNRGTPRACGTRPVARRPRRPDPATYRGARGDTCPMPSPTPTRGCSPPATPASHFQRARRKPALAQKRPVRARAPAGHYTRSRPPRASPGSPTSRTSHAPALAASRTRSPSHQKDRASPAAAWPGMSRPPVPSAPPAWRQASPAGTASATRIPPRPRSRTRSHFRRGDRCGACVGCSI